jgi:hypothetical protein
MSSSAGSGSTGGGRGTLSRKRAISERAVEELLRAIEERDAVAEPLGLLHDVRREDDRLALLLEVLEEVLEEDDVDGVEAGERLVEDEDLGVVHDGAQELHLLLHALRELFRLLAEPGAEVHGVDPGAEPLHGDVLGHALDGGEEDELVDDLHLAVEAAFLGQVADRSLLSFAGWPSTRISPRQAW